MNYYTVFYMISVADPLKKFFDFTSDIFTFFTVCAFIVYIIVRVGRATTISENELKDEAEEKIDPDTRAWDKAVKYTARLLYPFMAIALLTWILWAAIPSKKDCIMIALGGTIGNFIASDSSAKALPADATQFMHLYMKNAIDDLKKEDKQEMLASVGTDTTETEKEKLLNQLGNMTKDEIIDFFKNKPPATK